MPGAARKSKKGNRIQRSSTRAKPFPIVAIGASAGGLEAFTKFFENMPPNTGISFVLIQHMDPKRVSRLTELLSKKSRLNFHEVTVDVKIKPNCVYVIPPGKNMAVKRRALWLTDRGTVPGPAHSIDFFFRSIAQDLKEYAIGVILSGTGADGLLGARAIKEALGLVMVQEPETAGYDGMPRAVVEAGIADFVLPAEKMPEKLLEYVKKGYGRKGDRYKELEKQEADLQQIFSLIRLKTQRDFSGYKTSTIYRRLHRRLNIKEIEDLHKYHQYLKQNPREVQELVKDLLINVTSFFRDPEAFEAFKMEARHFIEKKPEGSEIRIWVAGCSTGEEAYSIGIIMEEIIEELKREYNYIIFGTDLDPDAIHTARTGIYPASVLSEISEERLRKYFIRKDDNYQIKRDIREKVIFAEQDVISDPPFLRMDIISTRNLLIYFGAELQKKRLIPMLHYALNEGGILFLGTAEAVGDFSSMFNTLNRKWKIFQSKNHPKNSLPPMNPQSSLRTSVLPTQTAGKKEPQSYPFSDIMLEALGPSILINQEYEILYTHGDTSKYVRLPQGRPHMNVLEMIHPELRAGLSSACREVLATNKKIVRESGKIRSNGGKATARVTILPVPIYKSGSKQRTLIITFDAMPEDKPIISQKGSVREKRIKEIEEELKFTKETLRSTIEELETTNEELRSANEEYQSTNEELQSTNEELETSREELQSVNEELMTVNSEHQKKIEELSLVNDDMKNLLNSTGIATIFLDNKLCVQRFTPAATTFFNLIETDIGRPLGHITSRVNFDDLATQAEKVIQSLVPVKEEIDIKGGRSYSMHIHPYRTMENTIAGVVISFVEITK